jgi:hypothetical protein
VLSLYKYIADATEKMKKSQKDIAYEAPVPYIDSGKFRSFSISISKAENVSKVVIEKWTSSGETKQPRPKEKYNACIQVPTSDP